MGSFITFFNILKGKSIEIRHFRNISFMVNIIIKSKWKRVCKRLIHLSSSLCLKIFLNLSIELDLCIIFQQVETKLY